MGVMRTGVVMSLLLLIKFTFTGYIDQGLTVTISAGK